MAGEEFRIGFEHFTGSARRCVTKAQDEARRCESPEIEVVHLFVGVVAERGGRGAVVLAARNITLERAQSVISSYSPAGGSPDGQIPFSAACSEAVDYALREALDLGSQEIGSEHLMLGMLATGDQPLREMMADLQVDPSGLVRELRDLPHSGSMPSNGPSAFDDHGPAEAETSAEDDHEGWIESTPTHQDRPATRDELGRQRLAEVLGERIRRVRGEDTEASVETEAERREKRKADNRQAKTAGAFLVHVHAPWGAGKSSFLNFLADDLRNRGPRVPVRPWAKPSKLFSRRTARNPRLSRWVMVEFSAWEHQRLTPPWWWLLAEIHRSCRRELRQIDLRRWIWFSIRDFAWRIWNARIGLFTVLILLGAFAVGWATDWLRADVGSLSALQAVLLVAATALSLGATILGLTKGAARWLAIGSADGAARFLRRSDDPLGAYQRRFNMLVRACSFPITVFIDDLDRCKADYVVELLEGIQTLFCEEPVTYVVAADRSWVCQSFAKAYSEFDTAVGEPGRPLGFLFLEKTFQISMEIPPMSQEDIKRYWESLMAPPQQAADGRGPRREAPSDAFADASTESDVEATIGTLIDAGYDGEGVYAAAMRRVNAPELQEKLERLLGDFAPLLEGNPRSMKRLMNSYGIERDRFLRNGRILTLSERRQLALLTILRIRWPLLAEHLQSVPDDARFCFQDPPGDHEFAEILRSPKVRALFDGSHVDERLDKIVLAGFLLVDDAD